MTTNPDRVWLELFDSAAAGKRIARIVLAAVLIAVVIGIASGLIGGFQIGLIVVACFAVIAVPVLLFAIGQNRRQSWIDGSVISTRTLGTRSVDLHDTSRLELITTDFRGMRMISLIAVGTRRRRPMMVALASFTLTSAKELGILPLRRLADALAGTGDANGLVLSQLLVAQLRAEARGESGAGRPLYQLALAVPEGRITQRIHPDVVTRFVTTLD